jgi:hypothetical protein
MKQHFYNGRNRKVYSHIKQILTVAGRTEKDSSVQDIYGCMPPRLQLLLLLLETPYMKQHQQ